MKTYDDASDNNPRKELRETVAPYFAPSRAEGSEVSHMNSTNENSTDKMNIQKPEHFDLERGMDAAMRVIRENVEWLKELAKR